MNRTDRAKKSMELAPDSFKALKGYSEAMSFMRHVMVDFPEEEEEGTFALIHLPVTNPGLTLLCWAFTRDDKERTVDNLLKQQVATQLFLEDRVQDRQKAFMVEFGTNVATSSRRGTSHNDWFLKRRSELGNTAFDEGIYNNQKRDKYMLIYPITCEEFKPTDKKVGYTQEDLKKWLKEVKNKENRECNASVKRGKCERGPHQRAEGAPRAPAGERVVGACALQVLTMDQELPGGAKTLPALERNTVVAAVLVVAMRYRIERTTTRLRMRLSVRKQRQLMQQVMDAPDCVPLSESIVQFCCTMASGVIPRATPRWWMRRRMGGTWEDLRQVDDVAGALLQGEATQWSSQWCPSAVCWRFPACPSSSSLPFIVSVCQDPAQRRTRGTTRQGAGEEWPAGRTGAAGGHLP
ncbi:hypothetical protein CBR_g23404 [Chara braunii]|uniref:Uncharacterized protein n=1 Tax=Chara braunii TaxID=69332 RepID=A0A388L4B1_CHABU|nr:hypothetical protein CBR_g23404 [Chara braunii]|eukprot:GBG77078.1 hypothetical protein CBR_g23404 [Chara braunii]